MSGHLQSLIVAVLVAFFFLLYVVVAYIAVREFQWGDEIRMRPGVRLAKKALEKRKGPE